MDTSRRICGLVLGFGLGVHPVAWALSCDEAWAQYNAFKDRNRMEASQYAGTRYGADVRAVCGADALPVAPGTDTPHIVVHRSTGRPLSPVSPVAPVSPSPPVAPLPTNGSTP